MADAAFNGDQIQIDAFGLHFPLAQRLQVIVFIAGDGELQFGHGFSFRHRAEKAAERSLLTKCRRFNN